MNFAVLDQVMVSAGNFLGGIMLARAFGIYEFGRFALAWMFVEFLGSLQFAAIVQPMLNIGPKQQAAESGRYYHAVILQQTILCALLAFVAWLCVSAGGHLLDDPDIGGTALALSAAVLAYQFQNFFRRYLFARDRPAAALLCDAIRFGIQIPLSILLPYLCSQPEARDGLWVIAAACATSACQGAVLFGRVTLTASDIRQVLARHWNFSKWLLPSALMFWLTTQGFMIMSGMVLGAAATGGLKAAISITGILNILLLALDNFAPVQAARSLHEGGPADLQRYIARLALLTSTLTAATVLAINVAPGYLIQVLYGEQYQGIEILVRMLCAPAAVYGAGTILIIWAAAMEKTRAIFVAYAAATAFTLLASYPITKYAGVTGVVVGSLLVELIKVAFLAVPLVRWSRATIRFDKEPALGPRIGEGRA